MTLVFARSLERPQEDGEGILFPEALYSQVKTVVENCPVHAITIESVEE